MLCKTLHCFGRATKKSRWFQNSSGKAIFIRWLRCSSLTYRQICSLFTPCHQTKIALINDCLICSGGADPLSPRAQTIPSSTRLGWRWRISLAQALNSVPPQFYKTGEGQVVTGSIHPQFYKTGDERLPTVLSCRCMVLKELYHIYRTKGRIWLSTDQCTLQDSTVMSHVIITNYFVK